MGTWQYILHFEGRSALFKLGVEVSRSQRRKGHKDRLVAYEPITKKDFDVAHFIGGNGVRTSTMRVYVRSCLTMNVPN